MRNHADAATPPAIAEAAALLSRVAGLRTDGERSVQTAAHIARAMTLTGAAGPAYRELLEQDPGAFQDLIRRVTVCETHFFRESGHLDLLRDQILPQLLRERPDGHQLQLWSAGCSTGEEAYTLAIILEEEGLADRSTVLATDISEDALRRARSARYRPWSLRGVEPHRREAYFNARADDQFELHGRFVERVTFRPLNLVADPYPSPATGGYDVILCRNVLIYLTPEAITEVVGRLTAALAPGGWLITASTDPHLSSAPGLRVVVGDRGIGYQRATGPTPTPGDRAARMEAGPNRRAVPAGARRPPRRGRGGESPTPAAATDRRPAVPPQRPASSVDPEVEREYHRATAFLEEGRWEEAAHAGRRALYLDPELVMANVVIGRAALQTGDLAGAARAWRNARTALERLDASASVPLAGGTSAGRLLVEVAALPSRPPEAR